MSIILLQNLFRLIMVVIYITLVIVQTLIAVRIDHVLESNLLVKYHIKPPNPLFC